VRTPLNVPQDVASGRRDSRVRPWRVVAAGAVVFVVGQVLASPPATTPGAVAPPSKVEPVESVAPLPPTLETAGPEERAALTALLTSPAWARQAIGCMRLERFTCAASLAQIRTFLHSPNWAMRCFALRSLAVRRSEPPPEWIAAEADPRVVRAILRCGFRVEPERLRIGYERLARSQDTLDRMLAVELAAASRDEKLREDARDVVASVIGRMTRAECGAVSSRLALVTGAPDVGRPYRWQDWLRKNRRSMVLRSADIFDRDESDMRSAVARLEESRFVALEAYMLELAPRNIDLAIVIDCTASMYGDIAQAQSGVDDLMHFVSGVVTSLRVGIVGFRDRRDVDFETRAWDLTDDLVELRKRLWSLTADGGGDRAELVYEGLMLAYTRLSWDPQRTRMLVLIGDAPPHVGFGGMCVDAAREGARVGLTTHVIQARLGRDRDGNRTQDVEHFREIAAAGGGRCIPIKQDDSLIVEIAGLAVGERCREEMVEFFGVYRRLCR